MCNSDAKFEVGFVMPFPDKLPFRKPRGWNISLLTLHLRESSALKESAVAEAMGAALSFPSTNAIPIQEQRSVHWPLRSRPKLPVLPAELGFPEQI